LTLLTFGCPTDKASKGGSQYLRLNENVSLLRHRQFCGADMASLEWPTSRVGENC